MNVSESDLEFYVIVEETYHEFYDGSFITNCVETNIEASDLPVDLACQYITIPKSNFSDNIKIELYDEDQNSGDDFYGSVSFRPADYIDAET